MFQFHSQNDAVAWLCAGGSGSGWLGWMVRMMVKLGVLCGSDAME